MQQSASTDSAKILIRVRCPVTPAFHTLPCAHRAFVHRARRLRACQPRCAACGAAAARLRIDADAAGDLEVQLRPAELYSTRSIEPTATSTSRPSLWRPVRLRDLVLVDVALAASGRRHGALQKVASRSRHFDDAPRFRVTARVILYRVAPFVSVGFTQYHLELTQVLLCW